jgi:hypothetical protein
METPAFASLVSLNQSADLWLTIIISGPFAGFFSQANAMVESFWHHNGQCYFKKKNPASLFLKNL